LSPRLLQAEFDLEKSSADIEAILGAARTSGSPAKLSMRDLPRGFNAA
jgi:hypothetical protein